MATAVASVQTLTSRILEKSVSGPTALLLSVLGPSSQAPALSVSVGPRRSLWRPTALALSVSGVCRAPAVSGPGALCVGGPATSGPLPSALCVGAAPGLDLDRHGPSSDPGATDTSSDPRATHPARHVPFFQERTPNLALWGKKCKELAATIQRRLICRKIRKPRALFPVSHALQDWFRRHA